ncbi:sugar phosphate isomerase/epimerase family protein [Aestuariimicrobium ganziense]|uniref:sugar phosphate isomerase/epimerase family protein n=1 Tax=Aestuariimicrobium ganziense TaxID=2773677 RepID=UPI0019410B48|nr:sugar phosphate isomerase/epimerase [Aestuariimicrobium ganziense]
MPSPSGSGSKVLLSTSSVYPESTASGFELAARLGYDGVELMVGIDPVAADVDYVEKLRDYHQVAVLGVHAPCLLVTQGTWGNDPWDKLQRSGEAARRLGADVVVVHPPFRWQREYARGFIDGIARLNAEFDDVDFAVENMYPWRTPAGLFQAYLPGWDPTELDYEHLTLDLSHAATARANSRELAREWGTRLRHLHLTDGQGSMKDEHLMPGEGNQQAFELLEDLREADFNGHTVLEVNSRKAGSRATRELLLGQALIEIRRRLGQPVDEVTISCVAEAQQQIAAGGDTPPDPAEVSDPLRPTHL